MEVYHDSCGLQAAQRSKRVGHNYHFHSMALLRSKEEQRAMRGAHPPRHFPTRGNGFEYKKRSSTMNFHPSVQRRLGIGWGPRSKRSARRDGGDLSVSDGGNCSYNLPTVIRALSKLALCSPLRHPAMLQTSRGHLSNKVAARSPWLLST